MDKDKKQELRRRIKFYRSDGAGRSSQYYFHIVDELIDELLAENERLLELVQRPPE